MKRSLTITSALVSALSASLCAQLPLSFVRSFVDPSFPTGNIGVTQDEVGFVYYVLAFQNPMTVHTFDPLGVPLSQFTSTTCAPALPTPNDITYDPFARTLWIVDNSGGNNVLEMSLQGACLGGWPIPVPVVNPVGICFDRNAGTLFIAHTAGVLHCDRAGNLLAGGFSFTPPSGSAVLSGITYVPATDRFLITQSVGNQVFEVDRNGSLLSTTGVSGFGIGNIQGLHYNPLLQELAIVDNTLSTTFVFDLPFCAGTTGHRGRGCFDGAGQRLLLGATGCPDLGATVTLQALAAPSPLPLLFAGGVSDTSFGGAPLPASLGILGTAPDCWLYTSSEAFAAVPMTGGSAALSLSVPNTSSLSGAQVFLQAMKLDPALTTPLQLATSNYVQLIVN